MLFNEFFAFRLNKFFWREGEIVSLEKFRGGTESGWLAMALRVLLIIATTHKFLESRLRILIVTFCHITLAIPCFSKLIDGFMGAVMVRDIFLGGIWICEKIYFPCPFRFQTWLDFFSTWIPGVFWCRGEMRRGMSRKWKHSVYFKIGLSNGI